MVEFNDTQFEDFEKMVEEQKQDQEFVEHQEGETITISQNDNHK